MEVVASCSDIIEKFMACEYGSKHFFKKLDHLKRYKKIGILCSDKEYFSLKMSLFFYDPEKEHFGEADSIMQHFFLFISSIK